MDVLQTLADIWLHSPDRNMVTAAQARIDHLLSQDPDNGQHLVEGLYRLVVPPLVVNYTVDLALRHIKVIAVRTTT